MKNLKLIIPNSLTIINLLCGTMAVVFMFEGKPGVSVFLLFAAAIADLLDGLLAKLLNATSEFGKQLDSLSDLVSFGVAPSIFMYVMLKESMAVHNPNIIQPSLSSGLIYLSFLIAAFAAIRLARYNIDTRKSSDFRGLPVPANAFIVISVWIAFHTTENNEAILWFSSTPFLIGLTILLSYLMVSNITMLSFKFQNLHFKENIWRYALIAGAVVIFGFGGITALLYIMVYYLLLSVVKHITMKLSVSEK